MKKNKSVYGKVIWFAVVLVIFLLIVFSGKLNLLGSAMSGEMNEEIAMLFSKDLGGYTLTLPKVLTAIAALAFTYLVCTALTFMLQHLGKNNRGRTVRELAISVVRYLGVILGIVWALSLLGLNPTAVFASLGIVTLIIGFGAQSLIEDVISGLFIIFEGQYNVGDIIVLDDFRGTVERIGMRTTSIVDAGGNYKIVNNSDIRNLQNRSKALSIAIMDVGVGYDADIPAVEKILNAAFDGMYERNQDMFMDKPYLLGVEELGASAVILRLAVRTKEQNVYVARRRLNREVRILFMEKNVEIPFQQITLHNAD